MKYLPSALAIVLTLESSWALPEDVRRDFIPGKIVNTKAFYPEGAQLLDDGSILVAEMPKSRVVRIDDRVTTTVWEEPGCGPTSIKRIPTGGYWVLCHLGHFVLKLSNDFKTVSRIKYSLSGRRISWPNDGYVDSNGNLYLSSSGLFSLAAPSDGRVLRIDVRKNTATDLVTGIRYSNGILIQPKLKRVLVSEHLSRRVLAFDLREDGSLGRRSTFFDFESAPPVDIPYDQSGPDGIAGFDNGDVIVADYGNGRLLQVDKAGRYQGTINIPLRYVTNVAIASDQHSIYVMMTRDIQSVELDGVVQRFDLRVRN